MTISQKVKDSTNVCIAAGTGYGTYYLSKKIIRKPLNKFYEAKLVNNIPQVENKQYMQAAENAYEKSQLAKKGIKIVHVTPINYMEIASKMNKDKIGFDWLNKKLEKLNKQALCEIAFGKNAGYIENSSAVYVNKNKMGISVFHELGHGITWKSGGLKAFNAGFSNLLPFAIPLVLIVGLLKNKKQDGEKPKGFWDKTTTFIKNNCAGISASLLVPSLIDEGLASYNGAKIAKNVLNKKMYTKLNKFNAIAYSSYLLGTILTYALVKTGVKIRDKIVDKKPIK